MKPAQKRKFSWRAAVQVFFLVLVIGIAASHSLAEQGIEIPILGSASLHSVCPFGGVVSLYQLFTQSTLVKKIHESSLVLMALVFGLSIVFGPVFCGWICPFGTIQDFISKLSKKIFGKKITVKVPAKLDAALRYARYLILAWVLYMTAMSGVLIFAEYDPYFALFNFWTGEVAISGYITLGIVLLASVFIQRPFCKYACPYGAVLGLTNLIKIFPVRRNKNTCISCKRCDSACPMNIEVSTAGAVRDHQCISCNECSSENSCPVLGTVAMKFKQWGTQNDK